MRRLLIVMFVGGCIYPSEKPAAAPAGSEEPAPVEATAVAAPEEQRPAEATPVVPPVERSDIVILDRLDFPQGSSDITEKGRAILDSVARDMKKYPEFALLEVAGHARPGVEPNPLALSRARSKRIVGELVLRGVAKERLVAAAYADYCPVQPEPLADARNGGVQFKVLFVRDQGPTGVNHGCPAATAAGLPPPAIDVPSK